MHLEQVRRYHPCTCTRYNGTTLVPARGTTVPPLYLHEVQRLSSQVWFQYKNDRNFTSVPPPGTRVLPSYLLRVQGWYRRTSWGYSGGTVVPPEGTGVVPSYLLRVQGWYRRTSRGAAVPLEVTHMVPSCLLDSARGSLSTPSDLSPPGTRDCDHTQPQLILNAQQTSIQGEHLVWVSLLWGGRQRRIAKT